MWRYLCCLICLSLVFVCFSTAIANETKKRETKCNSLKSISSENNAYIIWDAASDKLLGCSKSDSKEKKLNEKLKILSEDTDALAEFLSFREDSSFIDLESNGMKGHNIPIFGSLFKVKKERDVASKAFGSDNNFGHITRIIDESKANEASSKEYIFIRSPENRVEKKCVLFVFPDGHKAYPDTKKKNQKSCIFKTLPVHFELVPLYEIEYPTFSVKDAKVAEGGELEFEIFRVGEQKQSLPASINYSITSDLADEKDYIPHTDLNVINIAPHEPIPSIKVQTIDDSDYEEGENITVQIKNSLNAKVLNKPAIGYIRNNDTKLNEDKPTGGSQNNIISKIETDEIKIVDKPLQNESGPVTIADTDAIIEGQNLNFIVSRKAPLTAPVKIEYEVLGDFSEKGSFVLESGQSNEIISLGTNDNNLWEPDKEVTVKIHAISSKVEVIDSTAKGTVKEASQKPNCGVPGSYSNFLETAISISSVNRNNIYNRLYELKGTAPACSFIALNMNRVFVETLPDSPEESAQPLTTRADAFGQWELQYFAGGDNSTINAGIRSDAIAQSEAYIASPLSLEIPLVHNFEGAAGTTVLDVYASAQPISGNSYYDLRTAENNTAGRGILHSDTSNPACREDSVEYEIESLNSQTRIKAEYSLDIKFDAQACGFKITLKALAPSAADINSNHVILILKDGQVQSQVIERTDSSGVAKYDIPLPNVPNAYQFLVFNIGATSTANITNLSSGVYQANGRNSISYTTEEQAEVEKQNHEPQPDLAYEVVLQELSDAHITEWEQDHTIERTKTSTVFILGFDKLVDNEKGTVQQKIKTIRNHFSSKYLELEKICVIPNIEDDGTDWVLDKIQCRTVGTLGHQSKLQGTIKFPNYDFSSHSSKTQNSIYHETRNVELYLEVQGLTKKHGAKATDDRGQFNFTKKLIFQKDEVLSDPPEFPTELVLGILSLLIAAFGAWVAWKTYVAGRTTTTVSDGATPLVDEDESNPPTTNLLGKNLKYSEGDPRRLLDELKATFNTDIHIQKIKEIAEGADVEIGDIPPNTPINSWPKKLLVEASSQQRMGYLLRELLLSEYEGSFENYIDDLLSRLPIMKQKIIDNFNELEPEGVYDSTTSLYATIRTKYDLG